MKHFARKKKCHHRTRRTIMLISNRTFSPWCLRNTGSLTLAQVHAGGSKCPSTLLKACLRPVRKKGHWKEYHSVTMIMKITQLPFHAQWSRGHRVLGSFFSISTFLLWTSVLRCRTSNHFMSTSYVVFSPERAPIIFQKALLKLASTRKNVKISSPWDESLTFFV